MLGAGALLVPIVSATNAKASTYQMSADNSVTGWYPNEPLLSPSNVTDGDFGELFDTQLDGQVYAQPLVSQPTVLAVTENDYAYGLNSTTGAITWQDSFGTPADPLTNIGCGDIGNDLGITGTPVIDPTTDVAYFVAAEEVNNKAADFMEAVNVQTGATAPGWPSGGVPIVGTADGDANTTFQADYETQRPGLVLVNGVVYAAFGSQCDDDDWEGWLVGVSESTHEITTMWSSEEDVSGNGIEPGAGIWQSGSAPVVDSNGDIFVSTGNGQIPASPEPGSDTSVTTYGEAVVELHANSSGRLQVVDWFMAADAASLNGQDGDLGSGGPVALPTSMGTTDDLNPMIEDGKQGIVYVLNMNDLGGYQQGPSSGDEVEYESPPEGSVWGKPGVWPGDGGYIYLQTSGSTPLSTSGGSLQVLQRVDASGALSFQLVGSTSNSGNTFGYGSGSPIVTSVGTTSGSALVWIIHATSASGTGSQLEAFDPVPVNPGSDGTLEQVWSSAPFTSTVFSQPSVDSGIVYVGTKDDTLLGFGAVPSSTPPVSDSNLSFAPTIVAQSTTQNETFTATGPTTVSSFVVSGGAYTIGSPSRSLPASLSSGQSITVPVTFTPNALGTNTGVLTANLSGDTATVDLSGEGDTSSPSLSLSLDSVAFTAQPIGSSTVSIPETVTNISSSPITVDAIADPTLPFTLTGVPSTPLTLEPSGQSNDSLTFTVNFAPPGSSGDFDHDFNSLATLDTSLGNFGVAITASADPPAQITTVPNALNFGDVAVGSSATMSFDLGDQGGFPLTITSSTPPSTEGFTPLTNPFTQLANTTPEPDEIAPNSSIQETVQFAPTSNGSATANWYIEGNDGNGVQTITLTGTGYTPSSSSPPSPPSPPVTTTTTASSPPPTATTTTTIVPTIRILTRSGYLNSPLTLEITGDPHGGRVTYRVRKGTAKGCSITGAVLRAKGSGTCIVIATKGARGETPSVTSSPTTITFRRKP